MQKGTRKCSCCEEYKGPEDIALTEPCIVPAAEHKRLTGSTGSECRVVLCKTCYEQEIDPTPDEDDMLPAAVATLSKHISRA